MYNEKSVICENAYRLSEYMKANFDDYELVFCSDGSTDGCAEAVKKLMLPEALVIEYFPNRGKGCAVRTAMLRASGDLRIFTDADLAYGTGVIGRLCSLYYEHPETDVIIGSRSHDGGYGEYTALRTASSRVYAFMLKLLCGKGIHFSDSQCGLKAYSAKAAEEIFTRCMADNFAFDIETLLIADRLGLSVAELPVRVEKHGRSKVRLIRDAVTMLLEIPKIKRNVRRI